jgi:hypothetical protein
MDETMTAEVTAMNSYGAKALSHWRTHLPAQLAQVPDPEAFFTRLGQTAETEIDQLADSLAQPPGEGYLDEVARLETARRTAEMQVTRELILVDPQDQEKIAQLMG